MEIWVYVIQICNLTIMVILLFFFLLFKYEIVVCLGEDLPNIGFVVMPLSV